MCPDVRRVTNIPNPAGASETARRRTERAMNTARSVAFLGGRRRRAVDSKHDAYQLDNVLGHYLHERRRCR